MKALVGMFGICVVAALWMYAWVAGIAWLTGYKL